MYLDMQNEKDDSLIAIHHFDLAPFGRDTEKYIHVTRILKGLKS